MKKRRWIMMLILVVVFLKQQDVLAKNSPDYRTPAQKEFESFSLEKKDKIRNECCRLDLLNKKEDECDALGYNHPLQGDCTNDYNRMLEEYLTCFNDYFMGGAVCNYKTGNIGNNDDSNSLDKEGNSLLGLPFNSNINTSPCIGKTPKNSTPCPGDDEEVYYYAERKLADVCSIPEGSEPKCEYVCKSGYDFVNGECENSGIFIRIMNWFGSLF